MGYSNDPAKRALHIKRLSDARKGMRFSEERNRKISEGLKGHPCYKNAERGRKISESRKGVPPWNRGIKGAQRAWNKGQKANPEAIRKMVATRKSKSSYSHSAETIKKISCSMVQRMATIGTKKEGTDIEKIYAELLDMLGINYIRQHNFHNKFCVDFAFPEYKTVLEVDGEYWHSFEKQRKRDKARDIYIESCGWTVLRTKSDTIYAMGRLLPMVKAYILEGNPE